MEEITKVFNGVEIPVIIEGDDIWLDVSNVNKSEKVVFANWKNNKQTKKLLSYNKSILNLNKPLIDDEVLGKNFIHKKMFISYARFVSVEFESKADDILYDILTGDKKLIEAQRTLTDIKVKELEDKLDIQKIAYKNQLEQKDKKIDEIKRKNYAYKREGDFQCLTRIIKDTNADISANLLTKFLTKGGYVNSVEVVKKEIRPNNRDSIMEQGSNSILFHYDTVVKVMKQYDVDFIEKVNPQMTMEFKSN